MEWYSSLSPEVLKLMLERFDLFSLYIFSTGEEEAGSEFMTNEEETAGNQLRIHLGDIPVYSEVKPNIDNRFKQEWISTKEQQTAPLLELVLASLKGNEQKQEEP